MEFKEITTEDVVKKETYIDPLLKSRTIYFQPDVSLTREAVDNLAQVLKLPPNFADTFRAEHFIHARDINGDTKDGFVYSNNILTHDNLIEATEKKFGLTFRRGEERVTELEIKNEVGLEREGHKEPNHLQVEIVFSGKREQEEIIFFTRQVLALTKKAAEVSGDRLPIKLNLLQFNSDTMVRERFYSEFVGNREVTADLISSYANKRSKPSFLERMRELRSRRKQEA